MNTTTGVRVLHAGRISVLRCRHFPTALGLFLRMLRSRAPTSRSGARVSGAATTACGVVHWALRSAPRASRSKGNVRRVAPRVFDDAAG
jgi:hypothetical protein